MIGMMGYDPRPPLDFELGFQGFWKDLRIGCVVCVGSFLALRVHVIPRLSIKPEGCGLLMLRVRGLVGCLAFRLFGMTGVEGVH